MVLQKSSNLKASIAVIGCGYWGKNLIRNFYELNVLNAICDDDKILAETYSKKYSVPRMNLEDILHSKDINAIVIATPAKTHASIGLQALRAGMHVFIEKPLALSSLDAKKLIEMSKKYNKCLMVGHLLQYHPAFIKLKTIIKEKKIGNIKNIYSSRLSFGKIRNEEDVIWSFGPHDISMILSLADSQVSNVKSSKSSFLQKDITDIAHIDIKFKNGINAHVHLSWINPIKETKLVVIGDTGAIIFDDNQDWNSKLQLYSYNIDFKKSPPLIDKSRLEQIPVQDIEPLKDECKTFINQIENGTKSFSDGLEGLKVIQVIEKSMI